MSSATSSTPSTPSRWSTRAESPCSTPSSRSTPSPPSSPPSTPPRTPSSLNADPHHYRNAIFIGIRTDTGSYTLDLRANPFIPFRLCNCRLCLFIRGDKHPHFGEFASAREFDVWRAECTGLARRFAAQEELEAALAEEAVDRPSLDEEGFPHHHDRLDDLDDHRPHLGDSPGAEHLLRQRW